MSISFLLTNAFIYWYHRAASLLKRTFRLYFVFFPKSFVCVCVGGGSQVCKGYKGYNKSIRCRISGNLGSYVFLEI